MSLPRPAWIPDATALADFRTNPEAFRLRHRLGLVPAVPDDALRAGSAIHAYLDVHFQDRDLDTALRAAVRVRGAAAAGGTTKRPWSQIDAVARAYLARYPRSLDPFVVVANETYLEAVIHATGCDGTCNPAECFWYCGIVDRAVQFKADATEYVMDTKTTGAILAQSWWEGIPRAQLVGYVALRRALGHPAAGIYVDAIHFNDRTQRVDPIKDFYRFGPERVAEWQIERWKADTRYTLAQIAHLDATRGPNVPWPLYENWRYGKRDAYAAMYDAPPEMHAHTAKLYAKAAWDPEQVARERKE